MSLAYISLMKTVSNLWFSSYKDILPDPKLCKLES